MIKKTFFITALSMLIAANVFASPVLRYQNSGAFASWAEESYYCSPVVCDINFDGRNEIICAAYGVYVSDAENGELLWRVNAGYDRTHDFVEIGGNTGHTWSDLEVCDIDADGAYEIISGHSDGTISVLSSDGYFKPGWPKKPLDAPVRSLALADLDNRGITDIIAGYGVEDETNVWVYDCFGNLRGGWPQLEAAYQAEQIITDYKNNGWAWGVFADNITTGDIDSDGELEVIVPSDLSFVAAYKKDGTLCRANEEYYGGRTWAKIPFYEDYGTEIRMDNEGWGYQYTGKEKREDLFRSEMGYSGAVVADLDSDGRNEVVLSGIMVNRKYGSYPPTEYMTLFIVNGDRTRYYNKERGFDWRRIPTDLGAPLVDDYDIMCSHVDEKPVVEDLDGDGVSEILFSSYNGKLHCFSLDRTEKGAWPYSLTKRTSPLFEYASPPACVDIDFDGKKEVIFTSWYDRHQAVPDGTNGSLYILSCDGKLISKTPLPLSTEGAYMNGATASPTVCDSDGDGAYEVFVNTLHGAVCMYDL